MGRRPRMKRWRWWSEYEGGDASSDSVISGFAMYPAMRYSAMAFLQGMYRINSGPPGNCWKGTIVGVDSSTAVRTAAPHKWSSLSPLRCTHVNNTTLDPRPFSRCIPAISITLQRPSVISMHPYPYSGTGLRHLVWWIE